MIGKTYFYEDITAENCNEPEKIHVVQRPDANLMIGITRSDVIVGDDESTVHVIGCVDSDINDLNNWFFIEAGATITTSEDGIGTFVVPVDGLTAIAIIPPSGIVDDPEFTLMVKEYFPPGKIKNLAVDEYMVT